MPTISPEVLARRQKDVNGFLDKYHAILGKREAKLFKEIGPVWQRAGKRLDREIRSLYKQYADGQGKLAEDKLRTLRFKIEGRDALKRRIDEILQPVTAPLTKQVGNNLAYEYARSYYLSAFGLEQGGKVEVNIPAISAQQVIGVIDNPWLPDGKTYSDRLRQNTAALAEKAYQVIGRATVEGWDVNTAARTLSQVAGEGYFNSVRLVRTELTRAAAQGASQLYMENADILDTKRWVATLDGRTAARDRQNDGKVYDLAYDTTEMPGRIGERIPNHPHCRCRWAPVLSSLGVSARERIARGSGDSMGRYGERTYTQARDYAEYAKERGLPTLEESLANDDPRRYLRIGEKLPAGGPVAGKAPKAPVTVTPKPAPAPTPEPTAKVYTPLNDVKKATAWARSNLPIDFVDYKGFAPELADGVNAQLMALYERFPEMKGQTKFMGTGQERNRQALSSRLDDYWNRNPQLHGTMTKEEFIKRFGSRVKPKRMSGNTYGESTNASWKKQEGIAYNEAWAKDYVKLRKATTNDVATGWHPKGTEDPVSVLTHEFGHQLDNYLKATNPALKREFSLLRDEWHRASVLSKDGKAYYRSTLSVYASKNQEEFFAECFAEYVHNPQPREMAARFGELLEKTLGAIRKGGRP